jgi:hypothetical protein
MQRLVPRRHPPGVDAGGQGLHALAFPRQVEPGEIRSHRLMSITMLQGFRQLRHILLEPPRAIRGGVHAPLSHNFLGIPA